MSRRRKRNAAYIARRTASRRIRVARKGVEQAAARYNADPDNPLTIGELAKAHKRLAWWRTYHSKL